MTTTRLRGLHHKMTQSSQKHLCKQKIEIKYQEFIYIPPEKRQQIIDELRLIYKMNRMEHQKIINLLASENSKINYPDLEQKIGLK